MTTTMLNREIKIKREWCNSDEEHNMVHVVVEDNGDRLLIAPKEWEWFIKPIECIETQMVELI